VGQIDGGNGGTRALRIPKGKLVIRNIGLLLSGNLQTPILAANAIVTVDGIITALGKSRNPTSTQWLGPSMRRGRRSGPSIVLICTPSARAASSRHDVVALPSTMTRRELKH
jgi:hypothetical protein